MKGATRLAKYYLRSSMGKSLRTPVVYYTRGPSLDSGIHRGVIFRAQAVASVNPVVFPVWAVVIAIGPVSKGGDDDSNQGK